MKASRYRTLVLMGGGVDSAALLMYLRSQDVPCETLFFEYGQRAVVQERRAVSYFSERYGAPMHTVKFDIRQIAQSDILENSTSGKNVLAGRNVVFVMTAATLATTLGISRVAVGYHAEPPNAPFPDATLSAIEAMQHVLNVCYRPAIRLVAPFRAIPRQNILSYGMSQELGFECRVHTCYEGIDGGCGRCVHCRQLTTMLHNLEFGSAESLPENE